MTPDPEITVLRRARDLGTAPTPAAPTWYTHGLNRAAAYRLAALVAGALPRSLRLVLASALGSALAPWFPAERAAIRRAIDRIVPGAAPEARAALVREVFRHFAMCFSELVVPDGRAPERLVAHVHGAASLTALGRSGAIVLTAHLGNWELGGRLLARRLGRPTHVVVAAEADPAVERFLRRGPADVRFVVRTDSTSTLPLVAALRRGEIVAMQGDRALGTRGDVPVMFFGAPAPFPLGPFVLARAARVPVLPSFCLLAADRRYVVTLGEPIEVEPDAERAALARWVTTLEAAVADHPEQWFNFFDVWSPAPAS